MMVGRLLPGVEASADAADALAVAICHAHHRATANGGAAHRGRAVIAKLKGHVDSVDTDSAVIDVGGVGYLVSASSRTLRDLAVGGAGDHAGRDHRARGCDRALRLPRDGGARLVPHPDDGAGRRRAGWRCRSSRPCRPTRSRAPLPPRIARRSSRPAGVGPKLAARLATELKDKAAAFGVAPAAAARGQRRQPGGDARLDQRGRRLGAGQSRLQARRGLRRRGARDAAAGGGAPRSTP